MSLPEDELRKQFPQTNTTGSPALAGQPASITGQPAQQVPTSLPASPSGGNATIPRTPVGNGANESQGGAGNSLDLVKDRGTPIEYMQNNVNNLGSDRALELAQGSARKAKRQATGVSNPSNQAQGQAQAGVGGSGSGVLGSQENTLINPPVELNGEPPQSKRQIKRNIQQIDNIAEDLGMTDDKQGEANRASMENMFGDTYANAVSQEQTAGKITEKEAMIKNKKYQGVFKGMTRHEFSLFLWDWGASMMANGGEGLASVGMAGSDAMGAHRARIKEDQESALAATELKRTSGLEERAQVADTSRAESARINAEAARTRAESSAGGYQGEKVYLEKIYTELGYSKEEIGQIFSGAQSQDAVMDQVFDDLRKQRARAQEKEKMSSLPDSMRQRITLPDGTKVPVAELSDDQIIEMSEGVATKVMDARTRMRGGALPENDGSEPALGGGDIDKTAADYLNTAQTG